MTLLGLITGSSDLSSQRAVESARLVSITCILRAHRVVFYGCPNTLLRSGSLYKCAIVRFLMLEAQLRSDLAEVKVSAGQCPFPETWAVCGGICPLALSGF